MYPFRYLNTKVIWHQAIKSQAVLKLFNSIYSDSSRLSVYGRPASFLTEHGMRKKKELNTGKNMNIFSHAQY